LLPRLKNIENSGETAGALLFFRSPDRPRPGISGVHDASLADNSGEEQRKTAKLS
jgi:hypothetical protein